MTNYFVSMAYLSKDQSTKGYKWDVVSSESRMTSEFVQSVQDYLAEKYPNWQVCVLSVQRLDPS